MQHRGLAKIDVLLIVLVVIAGLVYLSRQSISIGGGGGAAQREACLANLATIGKGLSAYLDANDQRWPYVAKLRSLPMHNPPWPILPDVLKTYGGDGAGDAFRCPADRRTLSEDSPLVKQFGRQTTWYATEGSSYEWIWGEAYGGKRVGEETLTKAKGFGLGRADQPMLADFDAFHTGDDKGPFNTLNADLKPRTARTANR